MWFDCFTYRTGMRFAVVVLSVLLLTGCVGSDPPVTPAPTPSSTPLFASDAEALKAAEAAYKRFNDVADQILHDGGADPDRLKAVATGSLLKENLEGFKEARSKGLRSTGAVIARDIDLQSVNSDPSEAVVIYVCEDVSGVDLLDSSGTSVVKPNRPDSQLFEVTFSEIKLGALLPSRHEAWSSDC